MGVLERACALGLVTRNEVAHGLVRTAPGASGDLISIEVRHRPVAAVRRVRGAPRERQIQVLRRLAELDLGPRLLAAGAEEIWVETLPGRALGAGASLAELTDACAALGAALATLHREPVPPCGEPRSPRPVGPWTAGARTDRAPEPAAVETVRQHWRADPELRAAAARVEQRWSARHWVLGQLEPETVSVEPAPYGGVRFTDVSAAGLGHPDYDLAAGLGIIATVAGGGRPSAESEGSAAWLAEHFLHAYRRHGGGGMVHPQVQVVHALSTAWRRAVSGDSVGLVCAWLERAQRLAARRPGRLAA